jgi:anaerobic ribonucleoside-triphosphate reductase
MTKSIPRNTHCVDCNEKIKPGDSNVSFWKKEKAYRCENCTNKRVGTEVYSRIVGYIRPVQQWNVGKSAEFCDRKTFKV